MLEGKRILLVEDEAVIAFAVEDMLEDLGCVVVGPAFRLEQALSMAEQETLDAAILDVNLNDQRSYGVAEALLSRGIPFVFATGYAEAGIELETKAPLLPKPYRKDQIAAALERVLGAAEGDDEMSFSPSSRTA